MDTITHYLDSPSLSDEAVIRRAILASRALLSPDWTMRDAITFAAIQAELSHRGLDLPPEVEEIIPDMLWDRDLREAVNALMLKAYYTSKVHRIAG
jgi:hypothetical protein